MISMWENFKFSFWMARLDIGGNARIDHNLRTTVEKGAKFRLAPMACMNMKYLKHRERLIKSGILKLMNGYYALMADYLFLTPSEAACIIEGGSRNGYICWRALTDKGFKNLHDFGVRRKY